MPVKKNKPSRKKKKTLCKFLFNDKVLLLLRLISTALITFCILIIVLSGIKSIEHKASIQKTDLLNDKENFITALVPLAKENYRKYRILPSITIAQAILESNWGKSELSLKYNNYFGIKSFKDTENRVQLQTKEFYNDKMNLTQDYFRTYENLEESVAHHGLLIGTAPRYKYVLLSHDYKEASTELYKASYSTDPNYPGKLINIIEKYHLDAYDVK